MWVDAIKDKIPTVICTGLYQWLSVSWVFDKKELFYQITKSAQLHATEEFGDSETDKFPIPCSILSRFKRNTLVPYATLVL